MQDIRNQLNIKTIRWKVEGRNLKRIGHVMRMDDKRLTKAACLGWLNNLQTLPKCPEKKTKHYSTGGSSSEKRGMDVNEIDKLTQDRKGWRRAVKARMEHLHKWEKSNAKRQNGETTERKSYTPQATSNTCEICERDFKNQGGLRIHIKRMHKEARANFACNNCGAIFKSEN